MRKHIKREDGTPRAGKTIPLTVTRLVEARTQPAANEAHPGKLNYQAKSKRQPKVQPSVPQRVEKRIHAQGRFIGDGEKLTAFVWLDVETAPKGDAANE